MKNLKSNTIVLGTSLAPRNIEKQVKAVLSWVENGYYVIACNTKEEIKILKQAFENIPIEFMEVEKTSKNNLPYIQNILDIVSDKTNKVCGFINSDIILVPFPKGINELIVSEISDSFIFVRRNEIQQYSDIQELNWEPHFDGIDLFFIDKSLVKNFYNEGFYVQSIWDLCILLKCKILGIKIKELMNPIAFHRKHSIKWNFKDFCGLVEQFMKKYYGLDKGSYKDALKMYYTILYEDCIQICFCDREVIRKYKCLFVLNEEYRNTIQSVYNQESYEVEIRNSDKEKDHFDFIFYVHGNLVVSNIFCKVIIYIMEQFHCDFIGIGRYFVSQDENGRYFNELNRCIDMLKKINKECDIFTYICKKNKNMKSEKVLFLPISYELIDLYDNKIVDIIAPKGLGYIMPAGVRATEWYWNNNKNLKMNIIGYIDNDTSKIGKMILGKEIYPIEILAKDEDQISVIVASKYYMNEIEEELKKFIIEDRIYNTNNMILLENNGYIYYFNLKKYRDNIKRNN